MASTAEEVVYAGLAIFIGLIGTWAMYITLDQVVRELFVDLATQFGVPSGFLGGMTFFWAIFVYIFPFGLFSWGAYVAIRVQGDSYGLEGGI